MKHATIWTAMVLVAACLGALWSDASAQTPEQLDQMRAALPEQARVAPAAPRTLLVFNLCRGYRHEAVGLGAATLKALGERTGAFSVVISDDIAMFEPENLAKFDAVCFNNTTGELFLPPNLAELSAEAQEAAQAYDAALKQSLLDFVRGGKGLVGIHAATDTFYKWPEYGEIMGGYFWGHPWDEEVGIKVDDPLHALTAAFEAPTFRLADEIYQFREPYSRDNLRVLLSLDVATTDMNKGDQIHRTDGDFAVAWVRGYGQGRVFYCSLGHRPEVFTDPAVLQFYLDGIQFALGDLAADVTPSAALSEEYLEQTRAAGEAKALDHALQQISRLEYGDGVAAALVVEHAVRRAHGDAERLAALTSRLADTLGQEGVTPAGKRFLVEQLSLCATEDAIGVLVTMLDNDDESALALFALERIPGGAVDQALCAALDGASETTQIGICNALGRRAQPGTARALARLMRSDATLAVRHAAAAALGKVGGPAAVRALGRSDYAADPAFAAAYITAADSLVNAGDPGRALRHYRRILEKSGAPSARWAAFAGIVNARGANALPLLITAIEGDDPVLQQAANHCVREIGGADATLAFASALPGLAPSTQALLIAALSDRGDPAAAPAVLAAMESPDADVRLAAVRALVALGDHAAVLPLAEVAATARGAERDEARRSLSLLQPDSVDGAIVAHIADSGPAACAELVRSTVPRSIVEAVPALLLAAKHADPSVRAESFKALAVLAGPAELPQLLDLLTGLDGDAGRREAERAVTAVVRQAPSRDAAVDVICGRLAGAPAPARVSLLTVLGQISGDTALRAVREDVTHADPVVREAAVRTLTTWADSSPLEDVFALAKTADSETLRVLCLRGALRMIEQDSQLGGKPSFMSTRTFDEALVLYKRAMALATRSEEKKLILAGLANVPTPEAAKYIKTFAADPDLRVEAEQALEKVTRTGPQAWASDNSEAANKALDGVREAYWDSQTPQRSGMWFMVDLGRVQTVRGITLHSQRWNHVNDYAVRVSSDQKEWSAPVATGSGEASTVIQFDPRKARYIAIEVTGSPNNNWWTIEELEID